MRTALLACAVCLLAACSKSRPGPAAQAVAVKPAFATQPVGSDADDPAIWVHPGDPAKSLIIGTDKEAAPRGGLTVFNLSGQAVQRIEPLDRPNNVDVLTGFRTAAGESFDLAAAAERYCRCLRLYRIDAETGRLTEITPVAGIPVFAGEAGEAGEPMGIALYRRPTDGAAFAVVGRKTGPSGAYLHQYRLTIGPDGKAQGTKVREFGAYSGRNEIEAIAVDSELGYVYYADEGVGIRKYAADPDAPEAQRELALFGTSGFRGDHEGIALYRKPGGTGYLIATDQLDGNSEYHVFRREGEPGQPHIHRELGIFSGGADSTDGLDASSVPLGPQFPEGIVVAMNSKGKNFLVFDWREIARAVRIR